MPFMKLQQTAYKLVCIFLLIVLYFAGIPCILVQTILRPINKRLSIRLATAVTWATWTLASQIFKATTTIYGENITALSNLGGRNCLVISNHIGSVDFMLINELSKKAGMLAHSKYIIKDTLKFFPIFYQLVFYAGFLILKRNFEKDKPEIKNYFKFLKSLRIPAWIVLYPEGTRQTKEKKKASLKYCIERGYPIFKNVLFPRQKGFKLIIDELRNSYIKEIVDVTFWYSKNEVPKLWKIFFLFPDGHYKCDIRIVKIEDIADCENFLIDSFKRKDELIERWISETKMC